MSWNVSSWKVKSWLPRGLPILWLVVLCGLVFVQGLGDVGLLDETEPLFVEAARQMSVRGDWITPYFNGVPRFDKPPLIYWLMSIAFATFGVNEWSARLPSAIAATAMVAAVFGILGTVARGARSGNRSPWLPLPYLGSGIVALNLQMLFFGRTGYSDMVLNACFGGSLLAFFQAYQQPHAPERQQRWYLACWGLIALGVLTKGPVAIVLPVGIMGLFVWWTGQARSVAREMPWGWGIGLACIVALPWYGLVWRSNGSAFIDSFFGFHNVARFTQVVNQHSGPWYYHFVAILGGFFPWSLMLPGASVIVLKNQAWRSIDRTQHLGVLALVWFWGVLSFFSLSQTKYITYSLPAIPAAAILVALAWQHWREFPKSLGLKLTAVATCLGLIILSAATAYAPNWLNNDATMPDLGWHIELFRLNSTGCVIWLAGAIGVAGAIVWRRSQHIWQVLLPMTIAITLCFWLPVRQQVDLVRQLPLRQLARIIPSVQRSGEPIVMATTFFEKPSLVFYTRQPIVFLTRAVQLPPYLLTAAKTAESVLLVTTDDTLKEAQVVPQTRLATRGIYQLVRVQIQEN